MDKDTHSQTEAGEPSNSTSAGDERLEWETPKLIMENVEGVTDGGMFTNPHIDGVAYT